MAVDALAQAEGISLKKLQDNAAVGRGRIAGQRVLLAKPMTFMNASGESVGKLARFYKVTTSILQPCPPGLLHLAAGMMPLDCLQPKTAYMRCDDVPAGSHSEGGCVVR